MVAEDGKDDAEGNSSDSPIAPVLLESGGEMMSTTIPAATPNPNVTVRNPNLDIHDSSTFSSIHEGEINQQTMSEYIEMRVTEAKNEAIREYQALSTKRDCIPAIADTTQGNITTVVVDPEFRKLASHFAQNVHKMKSSTPASITTYIHENKLRNQENKRTILREMQNQIASCGLLTMMLGQRAKPEPTVDNPTGFSVGRNIIPDYNSSVDDTRSVASNPGPQIIEATNLLRKLGGSPSIWISDDNIELYQHDERRLLVIVRAMFHEIHHPFGESHYRNLDPVSYYDTVYHHVFSNVAHELDRHQTKLQLFRPNTAISFAHDYRRFSDIYEEIALIQKSHIPEPTMQAFLDKHYTHDPRPAISGALSHARNSH